MAQRAGSGSVRELREIVGAVPSDEELESLLKAVNSDVQRAINLFYERCQPPPAAPTARGEQKQATLGAFAHTASGRKRAHADVAFTPPEAPADGSERKSLASAPPTRRLGVADAQHKPLAERMRPRELEDLVGQEGALNELVVKAIELDKVPSLLLWGPPGCGKTSFAHVLSRRTKSLFRSISAAKANVEVVRSEIAKAANALTLGQRTILFVDEIHRFSKAQQDSLLADVERGTVTLIGATTENPSFSVNNAILSRCRLLVFAKVGTDALVALLSRALATDPGLAGVRADVRVLRALAAAADGDARVALNALELAAVAARPGAESGEGEEGGEGAGPVRAAADAAAAPAGRAPGAPAADGAAAPARRLRMADVARAMQQRALYDREGDGHYDLISAMHKSLRGGDADASLYYVARMLSAGEQPRYVTRRLIRFAAEDVGLADERALVQALAADQAVAAIGMPEAGVAIAQAVVFLAAAAKSCAVYRAWNAAMQAARDEPQYAVPMHIRNAPTKLMKELGYNDGYVYNPSDGYSRGCVQGYLPAEMEGRTFFDPQDCEAEPPLVLPIRRRADSGAALAADADHNGAEPSSDDDDT